MIWFPHPINKGYNSNNVRKLIGPLPFCFYIAVHVDIVRSFHARHPIILLYKCTIRTARLSVS